MIHLENKFGIQISTEFIDFIEQEVLPETSISAHRFWFGLAKVVKELTPTNKKPVSYTHLTLPTTPYV